MKKRILSMLLLVALFVTGIPVMAISASDTEEPIEYVTDIATLYVGADGSTTEGGATLVGLYTAFKGEENAYDLTAGKWFNKMDKATEDRATDAILRDTTDAAAWAATANGGLTAGISTKEIYAAVGYSIGIDLPVAWAAEANAVVETTAIAVGLTGITDPCIYPGDADETFRFDLLRGFFEPSTDAAATEGFTLNVVFRAKNSGWWDTDARNMNFRQACGVPGRASNSDKSKFAPTGLTMYMQKTTADNAVNYTVSYNNGSAISQDNGKAFDGVSGNALDKSAYDALAAAIPAKATNFSLFNRASMDVYTIRVYTGGILTEAEKQLNHFIDLCGYYGVAIPADLSDAQLAALAIRHVADVFATEDDDTKGTANFSAVKKTLEDDVAGILAEPEFSTPATMSDYDKLYAAQENLVGLFTAFSADDDSVRIYYNTWKNKVANGEDAILHDTHASIAFAAGANGGIAITGVTQSAYSADLAASVGIKLSDSYASLDAFTVESTSILTGIAYTNADGSANTSNTDADNQNFRFGALSCDFWINLNNLNGGVGLHMNWRNIPIPSGGYHWQGQRDTNVRAAYDAAGKTHVGLTQTVTMTTEADESKTYGVYYGSTNRKLNETLAKDNISKTQYEATVAAEQKKLGSFYLFGGTPAEVFAIRVYDKVLNAEEMAQNHFVDLLAFYDIAAPDGLTAATFAPFAPAAAKFANLPFYTDEAKATEAKAAIEASIEAVDKVVLLDDATDAPFTTIYPVNGEAALPIIIDGRTVIAYADMDMNYVFPGAKIAVEGTVKYYALGTAEPIISTDEKVDMKLYEETVGEGDEATTEQKLGIRFNATVNFAALQEKLDLMNEFIDDESLKIAIKNYGILVAPKAYVDAAGAFTVEALDAYAEANGSAAGTYVAISSEEWYDVDEPSAYKLVGGLVDFSAASIENNVEFAAIAFIELDVDEDPYSDTIVYGAYNADACITLKAAAENALAGMEVTAPEYAALNELLARFSGESEE